MLHRVNDHAVCFDLFSQTAMSICFSAMVIASFPTIPKKDSGNLRSVTTVWFLAALFLFSTIDVIFERILI